MRGQITYFSDGNKSGEIKGEDGQRYPFALDDLLYKNTLRYLARVDFDVQDGRAVAVDVLDENGFSIGGGGPDGIEDNLSIWGFFKRAISQKYFDFEGRARRKEYWSFALFYMLICSIVSGGGMVLLKGVVVEGQVGGNNYMASSGVVVVMVFFLLMFAFLIPSLSVLVRRLHDIGLSGWMILISFVPMIGSLVLFVMMVWPTSAGRNEYGPAPMHQRPKEENFDL